jgi:signal transduction histidine kinase
MSFKASTPAILILCLAAATAFAAERATPEQARAMLDRAVADVKADEDGALAKFNAAEGDYRQDDLYVFCFDANGGEFTAHPALMGQNVKDIKDVNDKALGQEMFANAKEGTISEIDYMWPRLGSEEPIAKHSYYTRVGDEVCGVGSYE